MHMARRWILLATLVLAAALVAGCTNKGTPTPVGNDTNTTPGVTPTKPGGGTTINGTKPADTNVTDSGAISGPFSKTWDIAVPNVGFKSAEIQFTLTGAQAGAPVTARVNLQLTDKDGKVVKSDTVGLGGSGDSVDWKLTVAELPAAGTYTLAAVAGAGPAPAPVPSVGVANYALTAMVMY